MAYEIFDALLAASCYQYGLGKLQTMKCYLTWPRKLLTMKCYSKHGLGKLLTMIMLLNMASVE